MSRFVYVVRCTNGERVFNFIMVSAGYREARAPKRGNVRVDTMRCSEADVEETQRRDGKTHPHDLVPSRSDGTHLVDRDSDISRTRREFSLAFLAPCT